MHVVDTEMLKVRLAIVETETERFPSFKCNIRIAFVTPGAGLGGRSNGVWFAIGDWQTFSSSFDSRLEVCTISDLSGDVRFDIRQDGLKYKFNIVFRRRVAGCGAGSVGLEFIADPDVYGQFLNFTKSVTREFVQLQAAK
jgi:hypothetical protein